jgi:molybdenum cofactor cytidylyltransferase
MTSIAILILAAGSSSRMKDIKQLLKIKDKTLLEITCENAKNSKAAPIFCVLGSNAGKIKKETRTQNIDFIYNSNYKTGLSSSIVTGIKFLEEKDFNLDAVLIMLADQPQVNTTYLNQLIALHQKNKDKIIASNYKGKSGVPAIFPKHYFADLKLLKEDKGARIFLQQNTSDTVLFEGPASLIDLDSPEEYRAYLKSLLL